MMDNKNSKIDDFERNLNDFFTAIDWKIHRRAAAELAKIFGAKKNYLKAARLGQFNLAVLLTNMENADSDKSFSRVDRKAMAKMGELAIEAHENKDYRKVVSLAEGLVFQHLAEYLQLTKRSDYALLTDHDLFKKEIIPHEIFFQYFFLESLAKDKKFNWAREEKIINQAFIFAGICFADIYDYLEAMN